MRRLFDQRLQEILGIDAADPAAVAGLPTDLRLVVEAAREQLAAASEAQRVLEANLERTSKELVNHTRRLRAEMGQTQRLRANLRVAGQRLRFHQERMPLGLVAWDSRWRVADWNPAATAIFGWSRDEMVGQPSTARVLGPAAVDELVEAVRSAASTGGSATVALRGRHKDGRDLICEWIVSLLRDEEGAPVGVTAMVHDVTERTLAQQALEASEARYALAVRGARDGIWDVDLTQDTTWFSPRCYELLGLSSLEPWLSLQDLLLQVHPLDRRRLARRLEAHVADRATSFEHEVRMLHADGSERWVLLRGAAVRDSSGMALRMAGSLTDITRRKRTEEDLLKASLTDGLTGLPNRRYFMQALDRVLARLRRHNDTGFAVLFVDMDRFKAVNDSLGHAVGDRLLAAIARRLVEQVRGEDLVARLGGDEFAVILDHAPTVEVAMGAAGRVGDALRRPFAIEGHDIDISASIGVAMSDVRFHRADDLLRDADIAMYRAKADGRARQILFDGSMYDEVRERLELEHDLRHAAERGELRLVYQPIVGLDALEPVGFEALLRWRRHGHENLPPDVFIPVAEDSGLIVELGEWVLDQACAQLARWRDQLDQPLYVSVNLSARQLTQSDMVATVAAALDRWDLPPELLGLEITETFVLHGPHGPAALSRLRDLGVRLFMDDFGTGYASLANLLHLDVDVIKVDRAFVEEALSGKGDFLRAILHLTRSLGKISVAEGVERSEQLALLRKLGCDQAQGFLLARPMEAEAVPEWLRQGQAAGGPSQVQVH